MATALPPDHVIAWALSHPLRLRILERVEDGAEFSPVALAHALDHSLPHLSYYVRQLERAGLIVRTGTRQVRGAVEHFYRLEVQARIVVRPARDGSPPG
jgi:DNA-binding transcriptional ArsR family regulator